MEIGDFISACTKLDPSQILFFVGSGFVLDLGYPSWENLLDDMAHRAQELSPELAALMKARLRSKDYLGAAELFFNPEIPQSVAQSYLEETFCRSPNLQRRHRLLGNLPVAAFITTNYDRTIEQAVVGSGRSPEDYFGPGRFGHFNRRLSVYRSDIEIRQKNALILKAHGDFRDLSEIVLGRAQFQRLCSMESCSYWYKNALSTSCIIFIGFSGSDPNFLHHCRTLHDVVGLPTIISYFLHPAGHEIAPDMSKANIVPVAYEPADNYRELCQILHKVALAFREKVKKGAPPVELESVGSEEAAHAIRFVYASLKQNIYAPAYACGIKGMVAHAVSRSSPGVTPERTLTELQRIYRLTATEAENVLADSGLQVSERTAADFAAAEELHAKALDCLEKGLLDRARGLDTGFPRKGSALHQVVKKVIEAAFTRYGCSLALAMLDSDSPNASMVDRAVRDAVSELDVPGIGDGEKGLLCLAFADLFSRPSEEEGQILVQLAQAAVALAMSFIHPSREDVLREIFPEEVCLDANVALPFLCTDHPKSAYYHEMIIRLRRYGADIWVHAGFINEMQNHYRRAVLEMQSAQISTAAEAKDYARFVGPLGVNVFIASFALGGQPAETLNDYVDSRLHLTRCDFAGFADALRALGIQTAHGPKGPHPGLQRVAYDIAEEKRKLHRLKAHVLAEHEAAQIHWLHVARKGVSVWFITEDAVLRSILRRMKDLPFSDAPPSRGVLPASGAFLVSSIFDRASRIDAGFAQLLWNPSYVDKVDTMLSQVLQDASIDLKQLRGVPLKKLRDLAREALEKEVAATEDEAIERRAREYRLGKPEMIASVLKFIGELADSGGRSG